MQELSGIFFLGLISLFAAVAIVWYRRNRKFLTREEREKASSVLSEANSWESRHLWTILITISLFWGFLYILEKFFAVSKATDLIFVLLFLTTSHSVWRRHKFYRNSDLPQKFVRGELALGIFMLLVYSIMVVFIFTD
jgi:uncharacterized membrane protein YbjE (DUF340 family)